jgi:iron complex outermembrane receptor protein
MKCKEPKFAKRFINIDEAYMTGFEAGFNLNFLKYFKYNLNASYTYAQNITLDEPLPEIPPFMLNTGIRFVTEKFTATFNARIAAKQERVSTSFNEATSSEFQVFNLK